MRKWKANMELLVGRKVENWGNFIWLIDDLKLLRVEVRINRDIGMYMGKQLNNDTKKNFYAVFIIQSSYFSL